MIMTVSNEGKNCYFLDKFCKLSQPRNASINYQDQLYIDKNKRTFQQIFCSFFNTKVDFL